MRQAITVSSRNAVLPLDVHICRKCESSGYLLCSYTTMIDLEHLIGLSQCRLGLLT